MQVLRARPPTPEELRWATNVIERQTENMARLVEDVLDVSRPLSVDGDATRLTQIVSNLLEHAAEHTDPGGQISLSGERDGEVVVISVKDTGVGIPSDVLPRVFEMCT